MRLRSNQLTDDGIAHLQRLKNLSCLSLSSDRITDAGLDHLEGLKFFSLTLRGNRITDAAVKHLHRLTADRGIIQLAVCSDEITYDALATLAGMQINTLRIGGPKVTDAGLKHLQNVKGLWGLNLVRNTVKGSGLQYLKGHPNNKDQPRIAELYLSDVTDEGLKYVAELPYLNRLYLVKPKCTDGGYACLKKKRLQNVCISSGAGKAMPSKYLEHVQKILPNCVVLDWFQLTGPDPPPPDDQG